MKCRASPGWSAADGCVGVFFEGLKLDFSCARLDQSDDFCGFAGEIDDALADIGPAVVDAYCHLTAVFHIGYPYPGAERQGFMGGGKVIHVKGFAVRRCSSVKSVGIVGCNPRGHQKAFGLAVNGSAVLHGCIVCKGAVAGRWSVSGKLKRVLAGGDGAGGHDGQKGGNNNFFASHIVRVSLRACVLWHCRPSE